jgi:hypothetical protein
MGWVRHVALDEMRNDYTILILGYYLEEEEDRRIILKRPWIKLA